MHKFLRCHVEPLTIPLNDYAPVLPANGFPIVSGRFKMMMLLLLLWCSNCCSCCCWCSDGFWASTYQQCMLCIFFYDQLLYYQPFDGNNLNCNNLQLATFVLHFAVADYCKMRQRSQSHTHLAISRLTVEK